MSALRARWETEALMGKGLECGGLLALLWVSMDFQVRGALLRS